MTELFYDHAGIDGARMHFPQSLARRLTAQQVQAHLQRDLGPQEGQRFASQLASKFPDGFNCWGIPTGGERVFNLLDAGDIVLLIGKIQVQPYPDGLFEYAATVQVKYPDPLHWTSQHVWGEARWPLMFFFGATKIALPWPTFLKDTGYLTTWNPQGMFYRVNPKRYGNLPGGDPDLYLQHIVKHYP